MTGFESCFPILLREEGGYVNNPLVGAVNELCYSGAWSIPKSSQRKSTSPSSRKVRGFMSFAIPKTPEHMAARSKGAQIAPMPRACAMRTTLGVVQANHLKRRSGIGSPERSAMSAGRPFAVKEHGHCASPIIALGGKQSLDRLRSKNSAGAACGANRHSLTSLTTFTISMATTSFSRLATQWTVSQSKNWPWKSQSAQSFAPFVTG